MTGCACTAFHRHPAFARFFSTARQNCVDEIRGVVLLFAHISQKFSTSFMIMTTFEFCLSILSLRAAFRAPFIELHLHWRGRADATDAKTLGSV